MTTDTTGQRLTDEQYAYLRDYARRAQRYIDRQTTCHAITAALDDLMTTRAELRRLEGVWERLDYAVDVMSFLADHIKEVAQCEYCVAMLAEFGITPAALVATASTEQESRR